MSVKRRDFLKLTGAALATPWLAGHATALAAGNASQRVVVVGGGYAGAALAKYIRLWSRHSIEVVVVERSRQFVSCPVSNLVLGGSRKINELTFGYDELRKNHGIQWVTDEVTGIHPEHKRIKMTRGELSYTKLVLAPGIDFIYDQLPMLQSAAAQSVIPHAWKAGPQTVQLRRQLESMPDKGVFVMTVPKMPFRCPPGPYERASQVALYFKQYKPAAKIIILDANPDIVSKKGLFTQAWAQLYPGMIDYRANSLVVDVDIRKGIVTTEFETVQGDVINVIPPQQAGKPAQIAGVANIDRHWCEVDFLTYESKVVPDVHVIGDAVSAGLPKSAHMATSQARVCAAAIIANIADQPPEKGPVFANTCYSYVSDTLAMHVAHVYRYDADKKIMVPAEGGGVSAKPSELEGKYARYWALNIWSDVLT